MSACCLAAPLSPLCSFLFLHQNDPNTTPTTYNQTHPNNANAANTPTPNAVAFAQFLSWADQPIYVLEKDNDLDIATLARRNAADILRVQPEGPYLLGGHSYGGTVAVEIALVLEAWGHEVGLVLVSRSLGGGGLARVARCWWWWCGVRCCLV